MNVLVLYADMLETFDDLSVCESGQLMKAIVAYHRGEEVDMQNLKPKIRIAFRFFKNHIDREKKKSASTGSKSLAGKISALKRKIRAIDGTLELDGLEYDELQELYEELKETSMQLQQNLNTTSTGVATETQHNFNTTSTGVATETSTHSQQNQHPLYQEQEQEQERKEKKQAKKEKLFQQVQEQIGATQQELTLLEDFYRYRREIGKPVKTSRSLKQFLVQLREAIAAGYDAHTAIETMKDNEWRTLELKWLRNKLGKPEEALSDAERLRRIN